MVSMQTKQGFRIPDRTDQLIQWAGNEHRTAVWRDDIAAWQITGIDRCYGDSSAMIKAYGNDWYTL